jgi:hypothetical protein
MFSSLESIYVQSGLNSMTDLGQYVPWSAVGIGAANAVQVFHAELIYSGIETDHHAFSACLGRLNFTFKARSVRL